MYITDVDEVIPLLRSKLRDYLVIKLGLRANARKIKCFAHSDSDPSMHFNPKTNDETVKCFACGWTGSIFDAAHYLDGLPLTGPEWIIETIPRLCEILDIQVKLGERNSAADTAKYRLKKLTQDITDILVSQEDPSGDAFDYIDRRNWNQDGLIVSSISEDELMSKLINSGWDTLEVNRSMLVRTKNFSFFDDDRVTFVINDNSGRPCGFISRPIGQNATSKYINSPETAIYNKSRILLGLDTAIKNGARKEGIYIVEGPGDLAQLYRLGIKNAAAICGTAFTEHHILLLKSLNVRKVYLSLDWDNPGHLATQRVLTNTIKAGTGVSVSVVLPPSESFEDFSGNPKDPDEWLCDKKNAESYLKLKILTGFDWQLAQSSTNDSPDIICQRMIPSIASETAAVKREILIQKLADFTAISHQAIANDVNNLRNDKLTERTEKLKTSVEQYMHSVTEDPANIVAHIAQHETRVMNIEKQYQRNTIGVNYQLSRYEAIQEERELSNDDADSTLFRMNWFTPFMNAMSGGMSMTSGVLGYVGGRANSGKTATVLALGCDVAMSDDNAMVIIHSTDDSYPQIEPRLKTNIYRMSNPTAPTLTIGMAVQPQVYLPQTQEYADVYNIADSLYRELIADEKLVVIDAEDGPYLSVLEKTVRYYRMRYPKRKILLVCDNTHNYMDFTNMDQTTRMTMISNHQKTITAKYKCCMIATAEYRKNMPMDHSKMRLPVDDDLADARALMYRPNFIFHVYNDMHDRKEHAEIFWSENGKIYPRLLLHFTKNKISGFKEKLVVDLDVSTVSLLPKLAGEALSEAERYRDAKESGVTKIKGDTITSTTSIEATEYEG
jgi:DNA primase